MRRAAIVALALGAVACGLFQSKGDELREDIVDTAMDQVGEDYEYGGADPSDGFDCSGLIYYSYGKSGIELPRSASAQRRAGRPIRFADARPADLLFYNFADRKKGDLHVVMYVGDGKGVRSLPQGRLKIGTEPVFRGKEAPSLFFLFFSPASGDSASRPAPSRWPRTPAAATGSARLPPGHAP
jgi:hypothetical protein